MRSILLATLLLTLPAQAALVKKTVSYKDGEAVLEGYLVYDDALKTRRPGVLVIHDWLGLAGENMRKVEATAKLGYVAFGADIYGKGVRPADAAEAAKVAGQWRSDRQALRQRVRAALETLMAQPQVSGRKIAATGYCFGGTTALELARAGAPLAGVVSFHGGLDSPTPSDGKNIKAKVLVLHGADDPMNTPANVAAFQDELRKAQVDWQMIEYGGAVHSFTIKSAGADKSKGAAYDEKADRRSWRATTEFLKEIL